MIYGIFINCSWVVTRWQYTFTHKQYTEQHKYKLMCPVFASFTLAFALQLRKKHGKTSVRVRKTSVRLRKTSVTVRYTYYQKHPHITKPSQTHTLQNPLIHTHTHARARARARMHTLQNNIKPPKYKLKRNAYSI